jgi:hypothetical protein
MENCSKAGEQQKKPGNSSKDEEQQKSWRTIAKLYNNSKAGEQQ